MYASQAQTTQRTARPQTPGSVRNPNTPTARSKTPKYPGEADSPRKIDPFSSPTIRVIRSSLVQEKQNKFQSKIARPLPKNRQRTLPHLNSANASVIHRLKESRPSTPKRAPLPRPSLVSNTPDVSELALTNVKGNQHVILLSMWEVYNDRIFELLSTVYGDNCNDTNKSRKSPQRRPVFFKTTEASPGKKVVTGLRKVVCGSYEEALMVLEAGLVERKVTSTETNRVSSRSHAFFCIEVKKKVMDRRNGMTTWVGNALTVVDLAGESGKKQEATAEQYTVTKSSKSGSERARNAKTT
ncbi:hypothetical protein KEM55_005470, partial [Ascosphaera atra]